MRYSACIVFVRVLKVGDHSALGEKVIISTMIGQSMTELRVCIFCCGAFVFSVVQSFNNPLVPCKMIFLCIICIV